MAEQPQSAAGLGTPSRSNRLSLTSRILMVNVLPLVLLGGGVIYLDVYRKQLLDERFKLALVEAQIIAEALAGASNARQAALLIQLGKEQKLRLRIYR
jgi:two-component system sensor histidine kinase ChvG